MEQKAQSKQEVEALQAKCSDDEKMIKERKAMVESELSEIQPQVDSAKKAVGELNPSNLNEIKNFRIPPDPVADVLGAVVQLLGENDTSWQSLKRFLSQPGIIQQIMNFDARSVKPSFRKKVNKIIHEKPMSFEHSVIYNVSRATAPLAAWVKANVMYSEVLLSIEPLTAELDGLMRKLEKSTQRVEECKQ